MGSMRSVYHVPMNVSLRLVGMKTSKCWSRSPPFSTLSKIFHNGRVLAITTLDRRMVVEVMVVIVVVETGIAVMVDPRDGAAIGIVIVTEIVIIHPVHSRSCIR